MLVLQVLRRGLHHRLSEALAFAFASHAPSLPAPFTHMTYCIHRRTCLVCQLRKFSCNCHKLRTVSRAPLRGCYASSPSPSSFSTSLLLLLPLGLFTAASVARCWGVDFGFYAAHTHKLYERHISRLILIVAKLWLSSKNWPSPLLSCSPSPSREMAPHASVSQVAIDARQTRVSSDPSRLLLYFSSSYSDCNLYSDIFIGFKQFYFR